MKTSDGEVKIAKNERTNKFHLLFFPDHEEGVLAIGNWDTEAEAKNVLDEMVLDSYQDSFAKA